MIASTRNRPWISVGVMLVILLVAPHFFYPVFLMKVLCFALFACAFNLLLGYVGLLSFGHAAFFGSAGYITAHMVKVLNFNPLAGFSAAFSFPRCSVWSSAGWPSAVPASTSP